MKVSGSETGCSKAWNWVFQALKLGVPGSETFHHGDSMQIAA